MSKPAKAFDRHPVRKLATAAATCSSTVRASSPSVIPQPLTCCRLCPGCSVRGVCRRELQGSKQGNVRRRVQRVQAMRSRSGTRSCVSLVATHLITLPSDEAQVVIHSRALSVLLLRVCLRSYSTLAQYTTVRERSVRVSSLARMGQVHFSIFVRPANGFREPRDVQAYDIQHNTFGQQKVQHSRHLADWVYNVIADEHLIRLGHRFNRCPSFLRSKDLIRS